MTANRTRSSSRPIKAGVCLLTGMVMLAACGGDDDDASSASPPKAPTEVVTPEAAPESHETSDQHEEAAAHETAPAAASAAPAYAAPATPAAAAPTAPAPTAAAKGSAPKPQAAGQPGAGKAPASAASGGSPGSAAAPAPSGGGAPTPGAAPAPGGASVPAPGGPLGNSEVGVTADRIKFGSISGVNTPLGNIVASPVTATVDAMFKSINDAGGVLGRKLTLTDCDDAGDVGRFRACFRKLVQEDKIFAFFTSITWGTGEVHGDLADAKVPWIGSWGFYTSEWKNPWMFPVHMSSQHEAHAAAIYARDVIKPKTVGILYLNSPEQLQAKKNIHEVLDPAGIKVVRELSQEIDTPDESANVLSMRAANPDHILAFSWPPPMTKFIVDATQQNYFPPMGLDSNHYAIEAVQELVGDFPIGKGLITITNFKVWSDNAEYLAIIRKYAPQLMKKHHHITQGAYVAARVFKEAATAVGPDLTRAKLMQKLESQPWDAGPGLGVQFYWKAGNHDTARCEYMWVYKGEPTGSQRVWEPDPRKYDICDTID